MKRRRTTRTLQQAMSFGWRATPRGKRRATNKLLNSKPFQILVVYNPKTDQPIAGPDGDSGIPLRGITIL